MKACLVVLVVVACNAETTRTPPDEAFPVGTYPRCARGVHTPAGNLFPNTAGFEAGAALTLAQGERDLLATYVDQNGVRQSFALTVTSTSTASLTRGDQVLPGFLGICVEDLENNRAYPAELTATAGTIVHSDGAIFVALTGGLRADAGACGVETDPDASVWMACDSSSAAPSESAPAGPDAELSDGAYACTSQVEAHAVLDGLNHYVSVGGTGTLTLTTDGASVSVAYGEDDALAGTLCLSATTPQSAVGVRGQLLTMPCPTGAPSDPPGTLRVDAAALSAVGSTLFVSAVGTTTGSSPCPDTRVAATLLCRQTTPASARPAARAAAAADPR